MDKPINLINKYYNLANYLCVKAMYLNNAEADIDTLTPDDIKKKVSGHWGNVSQINFLHAHLNYFAKKYNEDIGLIIGTGHSGLPLLINNYLDGTLSHNYKTLTLKNILEDFGQNDGFRSEISPEYPNTIYDGGELGYSLAVAYGAVLRNKTNIFCIIGDGEAETGSVCSGWLLNKFLDPQKDGLVIPILNLNRFKMGNPSVLSSFGKANLIKYFESMGYKPYYLTADHNMMQKTLAKIHKDILTYQNGKRVFPMIIFEVPKGHSAPDACGINFVNKQNSHKNPLPNILKDENELNYLKAWLKSYNCENSLPTSESIKETFGDILPERTINFSLSNAKSKTDSKLIIDTCEKILKQKDSSHNCLDEYFATLCKKDELFVVSPDELVSNKFKKTFSTTNKLEILNETVCQALAQGLINTKRNCIYNAYEAFMPIVNGMFDQYCKWLGECDKFAFRQKTNSLNYYLTSTCWENCYSHQNPAFIDNATNKTFDFVNILFPLDKTTKLLAAKDCLLSFNKINIMTASKSLDLDILKQKEAKTLISQGYLCLHQEPKAKTTIIVSGDYMYRRVNDIVAYINNTNKKYNYNLVYVYNPKALKDKTFVNFIGDTNLVYFFHGYEATAQRLLFHLKNNVSKVYGYSDACSRGSLENKFVDNGIDIKETAELLMELNK